MKLSHILSFALALLVLISCQKEENAINFEYNETGCSDPWGINSGAPDSEIETAIEAYLADKKVKTFDIEIDHSNDFTIVCEACHCLTGTVYIVSVDQRKESEMLDIGFTKQ